MQFVFEKRASGKYDRLRIVRGGGVEEIDCPKVGGIPHDMVHFAVENVMGRPGYMRRVAAGEPLAFRMATDIASDQMERLVEVMQADKLSRYPDAEEMIDMYRVTCRARNVEPYHVTKADIVALRAEMDRLSRLWDATPPGGTLALSFEQTMN